MSKFTYNLIILLIISITIAIIPISKELINIDLKKEPEKPIIVENKMTVEYEKLFDDIINEFSNLSFIVRINDKNYEIQDKYNVYVNDTLVVSLPTITTKIIDNIYEYTFTYDLSEFIDTTIDNKIRIEPSKEELITNNSSLTGEFIAKRDINYIKAINKTIEYYQVYYMDNNFNFLVPTLLKNNEGKINLRTLEDHFILGPDPQYGLPTGKLIPYSTNLQLKAKILTYNLKNDEALSYSQGSALAMAVLDMITYTFTDLDLVDEIRILVDGKTPDVDKYFHGIDLSNNLIPKVATPYLAIEENGRFLLYKELYASVNDVESMFNYLKTPPEVDKALPTVDSTINLISYSLVDGILKLNLSNDFLIAYKDMPNRMNLAIDSIVKSMFSLGNIKTIYFTVDSKPVINFNGIDLSKEHTDILVNPIK